MTPKMKRLAKSAATLAVVLGIIMLAFFSAQNKLGREQKRTDRTVETAARTTAAEEKTVTVADNEQSTETQINENADSKEPVPKRPAKDFIYTVQNGDTLYDLALTYDIPVEDIKNANDLTSDSLQLDQKLLMPVSGVKKAKLPKNVALVKKRGEAPVKTRKIYRVASRGSGRTVGEPVAWDTARNLYAIGETATVTDVETGLAFRIKRKGGHNHADNEPLTAEDAAIMKKIYGGSWSWDRRAVVLTVGDRKIAASMAGMPHGSENISNNDFSGHFDIHFKGSMTHGSEYTKSRRPVVDGQHQAMVRKAAGL